jgi:signal transduction histidine kinase
MTLRKKTLLIISVTLAGLIATLYAVSRVVLLGSFAELEEREAQRNVERVLSAVADDVSGVDQECHNAATWDDAYAFIQNANPDFVKSGIGSGNSGDLATRQVNVEVYIRSSGQILLGEGFDLAAQKETPMPEGLRNHLRAGSRLLAEGGVSGIVSLPQGPMLVASRPVLTTAGKGPIRGSLIVGRYLDAAAVKRLGERTHLSVTLLPVHDPRLPPDLLTARAPVSGQAPVLVRPLNPNTEAGYALLRDIYGEPLFALGVDMPREIYWRGQTSLLYVVISLVAVGFVFAAVTLVLLEKTILSRLTRLGADVTGIGEKSDLSARVSLHGSDELSSLAGVINRMLEALERSQQEIARRQRGQEEALIAKQIAEESSRAKSAFLANMSHELRTPLNAIIGYSEMLREDAQDKHEEQSVADLARITAAGKYLLTLINEVLDLSKVEAGKTELLWEDVLPALLLEDTARAMAPLARQNGNKLMVHCAPDLPPMHVDVMKFRQSLYNLLSNACKFTKNGNIRVDVVPVTVNGAEAIEWRVSDTGIGIAADQMHKLFQPFSQVDASTTRKYGGTGLGLAISQRFCELMGGGITVASEPGKGSTFTIRLPLGPSVSGAAGAKEPQGKSNHADVARNAKEQSAELATPATH